jgi:hypothetical protein
MVLHILFENKFNFLAIFSFDFLWYHIIHSQQSQGQLEWWWGT